MRPEKTKEAGIPGKMSENKKYRGFHSFWMSAVMFCITVLLVYAISLWKGMENVDIIRNTVICAMGCFTVLFFMAQASERKGYDYDNGEYTGRFLSAYLICLALAAACAYLPPAGWPFLVIYVALSLFSNTVIGICTGSLFLTMSLLLSGNGIEVFVLYFVCGAIGAGLFKGLDEAYKIGVPVLVSILFLLTAETACVVLYANETLKFELFQIPLLNVVISIILLLVVLKLFSALVIYRYRDRYLEINDQECALLVELKEKSREEYYHAVHTAYFCDRIAKKLKLDADAAKAAGYYHRIGLIQEENTWEQVEKTIVSYHFPPKVQALLKEYLDKQTPVRQKETAVLILSDAVISSILFLFEKDKNAVFEYDKIIDAVFKKKLEMHVLKKCCISMQEIDEMQNIFKEEKLYYDFLR